MGEVDLHVHSTLSHSSAVSIENLAQVYRASRRPLVTVTDYDSIEGCRRLRELLPEQTVLFGLEIRTAEGHFLIFSTDEAYLASLGQPFESVRQLRRGEDTVVIWAHPGVSQRAKGWEAPELPVVHAVAPFIDGLEIYNGTMMSLAGEGSVRRNYFSNLVRVALDRSLAMTGGSDTHEAEMVFRCGTKYPDEVRDAADLVRAIKQRRVAPVYDHRFFNVNISISG
jgi:hypothetical protein